MRVVVSLEGEAISMPWNSSKSAINYENPIFRALQDNLIEIVKYYAKLSRSLEGSWPSTVFPYEKGKNVIINDVSFPCKQKLNLPPAPKSKQRYEDKLKIENKITSDEKPWTKGILGGIIAVDLISSKKFEEKNRISLIILDSTLEIAFKEFLVNDSGATYNDAQLVNLFKNRDNVEKEIKKYISLRQEIWKKIRYYYNLRCKLVHERASVGISDEQIEDYTIIVQDALKEMFNLKF